MGKDWTGGHAWGFGPETEKPEQAWCVRCAQTLREFKKERMPCIYAPKPCKLTAQDLKRYLSL